MENLDRIRSSGATHYLRRLVNTSFVMSLIRWGLRIASALLIGVAGWLTIRYLATNEVLLLPDRLNLVSIVSTVALVLITAAYVRITARTLALLREERISAAEPLLYLSLNAVRLDPDNRLLLSIKNFGKGPAIKVKGEYGCRSARVGGEWLRHPAGSLPSLLAVGDEHAPVIQLSREDLELLQADSRHDGFSHYSSSVRGRPT